MFIGSLFGGRMLEKRRRIGLLLFGAALASAVVAPALAAGEFVASLYGGKAWVSNTDFTLRQPGGTDLTFKDVAWDDDSLEPPVYWGARLTWWLDGGQTRSAAGWGAALDFTHAKATANLDQTVHVSGTRGGAAVNADEPLGNTFSTLAFSHGLNIFTVNALYRWPTWSTGELGEMRPYAGAGLGIVWPHVEVGTGGQTTSAYSVAGPAYQGLAGLDFKVSERWSVFIEYKLSRAEIKADIAGGGSVEFKPWLQNAVLGAAYRF